MFLAAYKKENFNNTSMEFNQSKQKTNKKNNNFSQLDALIENDRKNEIKKNKRESNKSTISLDQFENKTKKGNKFGLLEYKRTNEIKHFDISNSNYLIFYNEKRF